MSQLSSPAQTMVFCGVDVSAATLAVAVRQQDQPVQQHEFTNTAIGHQALIEWLHKHGPAARVSLESTGIYSMDLALALDAACGVEVAVLNPRAAHRFAQTGTYYVRIEDYQRSGRAATAPLLAGQQVGVTAALPAEILTDGINDMLTSPHHGPMSVIDHRGVETGSRKVDYDYALLLPDSRPEPRAGAFDALLSAA